MCHWKIHQWTLMPFSVGDFLIIYLYLNEHTFELKPKLGSFHACRYHGCWASQSCFIWGFRANTWTSNSHRRGSRQHFGGFTATMYTSLIFLKHVVKSRLFLLQKSCSILTGPYHRRQFSERFDFQIGEVMLAAFDAKLGEARRDRKSVV